MTLLEEYKKRYETTFQGDIGLSRKFMPEVRKILIAILPREIRNNEGTELNGQGSDLTILPSSPTQVGVRIRRTFAAKYDQFTQDDKERTLMSCDLYFLGYANKEETELTSHMVWDGKEYEIKRNSGEIPLAERKQNRKHSLVWFNCYQNLDIKSHCKIFAIQGRIAWCPRQPRLTPVSQEKQISPNILERIEILRAEGQMLSAIASEVEMSVADVAQLLKELR